MPNIIHSAAEPLQLQVGSSWFRFEGTTTTIFAWEKSEREKSPRRNKREAASEGVARTTNAVEGWHFGMQAFFSGSHPSLWRTLENLKKDAATQKYLYLQSTAGTEFSRRKKYRELEAKVKNAIERHQDENTIAFLRAMASLSMSNWTLWINFYKFCVHRAWIFKKFTFLKNYKAFPSENLTQ